MRKPGYALATILVLLGVCLFGVGALVSVSGLEVKISRSHQEGVTAYYTAEAGMADALWQVNNNAIYRAALSAGTLAATYTANDAPLVGQSYTVTMTPSTKGRGYGIIIVNAQVNATNFTARRQIQSEVFLGGSGGGSLLGNNALVAGGSLSLTNGSTQVLLPNSDLYAGASISINQATVNAGTGKIRTPGSYSANHSTVVSGGVESSNNPPAPTPLSIPGISFSTYASQATVTYTSNQFQNLIRNGGSTITLPGPITYVSGSVNLTSFARNKRLVVNGVLVINGSFSIVSSASNFTMQINDPGNGKSGLLVSGSASLNQGAITVDGVIYSAGSCSSTGIPALVVRGALVCAGAASLNAGSNLTLTVDTNRTGAIFGVTAGSGSDAVEIKHWEEEY